MSVLVKIKGVQREILDNFIYQTKYSYFTHCQTLLNIIQCLFS